MIDYLQPVLAIQSKLYIYSRRDAEKLQVQGTSNEGQGKT